MKRSLLIIMLLITATLSADEVLSADNMVNASAYLSVPADHEHVSIQPGVILNPDFPGFLVTGVNIPFGGPYYVYGELGAGLDRYEQKALTLIDLGLGYYNQLPGTEALYYSLNASFRTLRSSFYTSTILSGGGMIEQNYKKLHFGIGLSVNIQDYAISGSDIYAAAENKVYKLLVNVVCRSPYMNIEVKGMPNTISAGISFTFNLET